MYFIIAKKPKNTIMIKTFNSKKMPFHKHQVRSVGYCSINKCNLSTW